MKKIILAITNAQAILINKGYVLDDYMINEESIIQLDSSSLAEESARVEFPQQPLNLQGKKYKDFDLKDEEIPWTTDRMELFEEFKNKSKTNQPAGKSTIDWAGIPDSLIEKMKENDVMPGKGIPNRIMTSGPWEPEWFESYSQQFMPNNTEFKFYNYSEVSSEVHRISQEMEKVGIKGAEQAYNLLRPYAFKKDLFQWMALWDTGGIFMDAKMGFNKTVTDWIDFNNDEFITCGAPGMYTNNAIMAMTKHHPYGLIQVQNVIDKVNDRTYYVPYDASGGKQLSNLNITGPDSIRSLFIQDHQLTWYNMRCYMEKNQTTHQWSAFAANNEKGNNRTVLALSDPVKGGESVTEKMKSCKTCNNYTDLFWKRQVYCDQPGPDCDGHNFTFFQDSNTWKHMNSMNEEWYPIRFDRYFSDDAKIKERNVFHDLDLQHNLTALTDFMTEHNLSSQMVIDKLSQNSKGEDFSINVQVKQTKQ